MKLNPDKCHLLLNTEEQYFLKNKYFFMENALCKNINR